MNTINEKTCSVKFISIIAEIKEDKYRKDIQFRVRRAYYYQDYLTSQTQSTDLTQSYQKFHLGFLVEFDNLILKFIWKCKGPKIVKTILKRVKTIGRLTFLDIKIYYKAKITTTKCY